MIYFEILNINKLTKNKWSGGTTTEIAIFPKEANYAKRKFLWRISSAEVNTEKSIFTKLPNVKRILMILKGKLKLKHKDRYEVLLNEFEQDSFLGGFDTSSEGKVIDFNLMMKENTTGQIKQSYVKNNELIVEKITRSNLRKTKVIYCFEGETYINLEKNDYILKKGQIIIINSDGNDSKEIIIKGNANLIITDIEY